MANVSNPHGLLWLRRKGGGPEEIKYFSKLAAYGTAIFINDVVIQVAGDSVSGAILNAWASATPGTTAPSGVSKSFSAASTLADNTNLSKAIAVNVDDQSVFEAQTDNNGFALAQHGLNALVTTDAGSLTNKISGQQIGTIQTSASSDVHILGLYPDINNTYGANARVEVIFNHHRYFPGTAGV